MINVKLPDGRTIKVNTTDPKAAAAAAKKFMASSQAPQQPSTAQNIMGAVKEVGTEIARATPSFVRSALTTARNVAIEGLTPNQSSAEAIGLPQIGSDVLLKRFTGNEQGPIEQATRELGQSFRERPVETGLSVAAGLTPLGRGAGLLATGGRFLGRMGLGTAGTLGGAEVDKSLFEATGGLAGREGESGDPTVFQAAATQLLGEGVGAALRAASPMMARKAISDAQTRLARAEKEFAARVAANPSAAANADVKRNLDSARQQVTKLQELANTSKEAVLKQAQADGSLFEKNGKDMRSAMVALAGDAKAADKLLYADEIYDAGQTANLKTPWFGGYEKQVRAKERELTRTLDNALAPQGIGPSSVQGYTDYIRKKISSVEANLAAKASKSERAVFAPPKANTPILGSELAKILDAPEVVARMAGIGARDTKLAAIRAAIPSGRALTTEDLSNFMSRVQSQFVTKDDDKARAVFYKEVYPKLEALFKDVASRPTGAAARAYSQSFLDYFNSRFNLSNLNDDVVKQATEGKPEAVMNILSSPEALASFTRTMKETLSLKDDEVRRYVQTIVKEGMKDNSGNYSASAAARILGNIDTTVAEQVLGKEYLDKLLATDTVLSGIEQRGVRSRVASIARGDDMAAGNRTEQAVQNIVIGTATGQPLQAGAGRAQLGRNIVGMLRPLNLDNASFDYVASAAERNLPPEQVFATLGRLAVEAGKPLAFGYTTFQERYNALQAERDKLKQSMPTQGGQGGPEGELAPSMQQQPDDLGQFIDGLTGRDPMGQLIQTTSDQADLHARMDDVDALVKSQVEEDSRVVNKVSTRQEEGFRTRVYRDSLGFRTIGIGFNMEAAGARQIWRDSGVATSFDDALTGRKTISKAEAEALFAATKQTARNNASRLVRNYDKLGTHQQDALIDMVFQLGPTGAMKFVRTRGLIEAGKFREAAAAMLESANARQTPNRVMRRAYMLQHNVSLAEADAALVKAGKISRKESINSPQELSRLMNQVQVAAAPSAPTQPKAKPAPKKRVRYAEAKAKRGLV